MASASLHYCLLLLLVASSGARAARSVPPRLSNHTDEVRSTRAARSVPPRLSNHTDEVRPARRSTLLRGPATVAAKSPNHSILPNRSIAPNHSTEVKHARLLEMKKQAVNRTASLVFHPHQITVAQPKLIPATMHLSALKKPAQEQEDMCGCEVEHECTCRSTMKSLHCVVDSCMALDCECNQGSFVDACERLASKCGNLEMKCSKERAVCESHFEHTRERGRKKGLPWWWKSKKKQSEDKEAENKKTVEEESSETEAKEPKKEKIDEENPMAEVVKKIHDVVEELDEKAHNIFEGNNATKKEKSTGAKEEKAEKDEQEEKTQNAEKEEEEKDHGEEGEEKDEEEEEVVEPETATTTPKVLVMDEHEEFELNKHERGALTKFGVDYEKVYSELYDLKERKCRLMFAMNDGWENLEDRLNRVLKKINQVLQALENAGKKLPEMHCYKHFEEWHEPPDNNTEAKSSSLRLSPATVTAAVAIGAAVAIIRGRP